MDYYIKLAQDTIKFYLKEKAYIDIYPDELKYNNTGIIVKIENNTRLKGESGSIYPTRQNTATDIIYETINAGFFSYAYIPITEENLLDHKITIYEFTEVKQIKYIEEFGDWDGICISFNDENFLVYRDDFDSSEQMFKQVIEEANLDSWDIFVIEKFKVNIHQG